MAKRQNTAADTVFKSVTASTNNDNDKNYHHYFEQDETYKLTFEVEIDSPSVDNIHFVLWNLNDPVNPKMVKSIDRPVEDGHATITVGPHLDEHLGPGPYCAALTASSLITPPASHEGGVKIVDDAVYYYDTWKDNRRYNWPVLS